MPPCFFSAALCSEIRLFSHAKPTIKALQQSKKLCFAKILRLNKAIFTAFQEKDNGFDLQQAQRTLKDHFAEAEQMTMYLVDHLPEDITEDFLINSFTDLQDEIDDAVKIFKQMLKETNQHSDPVEPSQIQQPFSHNQPTSHDHLPSTSALPHLPDYWETNSPIRLHHFHSNLL